MLNMKHYTIVVTGKVQGVFFRANTKEQAQKLGLCGWVQNEADGSVRIEAEGEEADLQQLVDWCKRGPRLAQVADVVVQPGEIAHSTDFTVRR